MYDARRGAALALLRDCHPKGIDDVQSAGDRLVTRGGMQLKVWDIHPVLSAGVDTSSAAAHTGHQQKVTHLVVHPQSRAVVSTSADLTAASWREGDAQRYAAGRVGTYAGHDKPVRCCDVSPDGTLVATACEDRRVRVYELASGRLLHKWRHPGRQFSEDGVSSVAWSPLGGGLLASANGEGMDIAFWRVPPLTTPPPRLTPPADAAPEVAALCEQLQRQIDEEGVVHLAAEFGVESASPYALELRQAFEVSLEEQPSPPISPPISPEGQPSPDASDGRVRVGGGGFRDRVVRVALRASGQEVGRLPHPLQLLIPGHDYWADGCRCIWSADGDGAKQSAGRCPRPGHSWSVEALRFSPCGHVLASSSRDQTVRLWEGRTGAWLRTIERFGDDTMMIAWRPDSTMIATGAPSPKSASDPQVCALWPLHADGPLELEPTHPFGGVAALSWAPTSDVLAVATRASGGRTPHAARGPSIVLYNVGPDGAPRRWTSLIAGGVSAAAEASAVADEVRDVTFVGGGSDYLAAATGSGRCRLFRCRDGTGVCEFFADAPLTHVVSCGDASTGILLAAGSELGRVHLLSPTLPREEEALGLSALSFDGTGASDAPGGTAQGSRVASVGVGIFKGLELASAAGVGLGELLTTLVELARGAEARAVMAATEEGGATLTLLMPKQCVVCMAEPRQVRFQCGHCVCCESCAKRWRQAGGGCPSCRMPMVIVERGELSRADSFERSYKTYGANRSRG